MPPIRQGDVTLLPLDRTEREMLPHLTLAKGEVTRHKHRRAGERSPVVRTFYGTLYLPRAFKDALLAHVGRAFS